MALLGATFVIAICGLVYELIAGSVSSYLLGDSVYHFSLVIGLFMSAMGVGAYLSRHVREPEAAFVAAQTALGVIGGFSAMILFAAFALIENYSAFLFLVCLTIGALIGIEIPLVMRILEGREALKVTVSNVLTADYIGALAAALLFPLVLVPQLGLMGASFLLGALNLAVAGMALWLFRARCGAGLRGAFALSVLAVCMGAWQSEAALGGMERRLYENEIVLAQDTPYQRVVVARDGARVQLFLNASIQFDTLDEHRYHESLVHPAMTHAPRIAEVLVLGGGDGMAVREVLRYPGVARVTLVDIDAEVTTLFRDHPALAPLNDRALSDPRVTVVNADAWEYLKDGGGGAKFDVAILDLPGGHIPLNPLHQIGQPRGGIGAGNGGRGPGHGGQAGGVGQQPGDNAAQRLGRQPPLRHGQRGPGGGQPFGIRALMIAHGGGQGDEDRGAADNGQLGTGRRPRPRNDQMRARNPLRHIVEERRGLDIGDVGGVVMIAQHGDLTLARLLRHADARAQVIGQERQRGRQQVGQHARPL